MVKLKNFIIKLKSIRFSINGDSILEKSFWKHHGWKLYALLFSIILAFSISNNLNEFVDEQTQNWIISPSTFFSLLNDHFMVNLLTTVGLIALLIYLIIKKWQDKYFSFSEFIIAVITCIFLCKQDSWDYASTVTPCINYNILLTAFCAIPYVIIPIYKCFYTKKAVQRQHGKIIQFSSDSIETQNISEGRKAYAEALTKQLLDSISINQEAFAVGITGEWGSGKSLFLKSVEEAFSDKAIIVKFNPWNSQDEQHLVKDYFDTLALALAPYHGGILPPLKKYVSLLYSLKLQIASDAILQYLPKHEGNNLDKRRIDVENCLKNLGRPVVVLIDDIDRLEGHEIFEVLRIIRNTGQFSNMIYIVTYDKSHVETQLSKNQLGIDPNYLEKIFQLELSLPKADERSLINEFKKECRRMSKDIAIMNSLLDKLTEKDVHQIINILGSYRKVKRFARQFTFNSNFMYSTFIDSNFSLRDILMLNLLGFSNSNLYRLLWDNPSKFFKEKELPNGYRCYMIDQNHYTHELKIANASEPEKYFLNRLFEDNSRSNSNSIKFVDSYYKYFYLAQPEMELSLREFNNMLGMSPSPNAKPGMKSEIRSWILSKDTKSISSIFHCFVESAKKKKKNQRDINKISNLITAAFYWLEYEYRNDTEMVSLLPQILLTSLYDVNYHLSIVSIVEKQISTFIKKDNYVKTAKVLSALYVATIQSNLLVNGNMVLEWLKLNLNRMFTNNTWNAVLLFRDDGNPLKAVVSACCIALPPDTTYKNLLIEDVIKHFSKPKNQSKLIDEVDLVRKRLKAYTENNDVDCPDEWETIKKVFGDDMEVTLRYLDTCFQWNQ